MTSKTTMLRREFAMLRDPIPVRYKFLNKSTGGPLSDDIFHGTTVDLNSSGMRLEGRIPDAAWTSGMLTRKVYLGVNIQVPGIVYPVKALARVLWVEAWDGDPNPTGMGVKFRDLAAVDRLKIADIVAQIRKSVASTRLSPLDL